MKKNKPVFIGIAGGSGSGKSTLCTALQNKYPGKIGLVQLDDYFKPEKDVPVFNGHKNWDDPDALYLDKLYNDLTKLAEGNSVMINTKNEKLNPDYKKTKKRILVQFNPKPIILIEGYLILYDKRIRDLIDKSLWLEANHKQRWERRVHFKYPEYEKEVIIPMYKKFVEPTKKYTDYIIDVSNILKEGVFDRVEKIISEYLV